MMEVTSPKGEIRPGADGRRILVFHRRLGPGGPQVGRFGHAKDRTAGV